MQKRSNPPVLALGAFFILAALLWGCGGGGGGGTGGGNGGGGNGGGLTGTIFVEASLPSSVVDPLNIQVGESATFFLAGYDNAGVRKTATVNGWTTTDTNGVAGTLASNGTFTARSTANANVFTASVVYGGNTYSVQYKVNPNQARVSAHVNDQNTGKGIRNIKLVFYNSAGVPVGSARSSFSGTILASVPKTAKRFNIDPNSIDTSVYYSTFTYGGLRFAPLITTCSAALPTLTNGVVTPLATQVVLTSSDSVPPPPPTGCQ